MQALSLRSLVSRSCFPSEGERARCFSDPTFASRPIARALSELGMHEAAIDQAADLAVRNAYPNPRPLEREALRRLLARAWAGDPPLTEPQELADARIR